MSYELQLRIVGGAHKVDAGDTLRSVTIGAFDRLDDARALNRAITKLIWASLDVHEVLSEGGSGVVAQSDSPA